jgi:hypothetical protein
MRGCQDRACPEINRGRMPVARVAPVLSQPRGEGEQRKDVAAANLTYGQIPFEKATVRGEAERWLSQLARTATPSTAIYKLPFSDRTAAASSSRS